MYKFFSFFTQKQNYSNEFELEYKRVDKDTFEVDNGHAVISIRVVTPFRAKQLEEAREIVESKNLSTVEK